MATTDPLYRVRVPALERLALAGLAERTGQTEEAVLARLIRQELARELAQQARKSVGCIRRAQRGEGSQP